MCEAQRSWMSCSPWNQKVKRRSSSSDSDIVLDRLPGSTPIVPVLRQVLQDKHSQIHERKLLILLATDGVPTDEQGRPDIRTLQQVLTNERRPINQVPVTIIACTGTPKGVSSFGSCLTYFVLF